MDMDEEEISNGDSNTVLNDRITSTVDTEFASVYRKLPKKTAVTIRLFERNEHYTCHGEDALFIARELLQSTNALKYWKTADANKPLETIYISNKQFEDILRKLLLIKQYRVEIWKKAKNANDWSLGYHGSPGNLTQFEDILYSSSTVSQGSSGVVSCKLGTDNGATIVGLALIDVQTLTIKMCEVTVSNHYSNLETILVQLGPKECLLPTFTSTEDNYLQLKKVIEKSGVLVTERPKVEYSSKDIKQDLCRLLVKGKEEDNEKFEMKVGAMPEMQMEHAKSALSAAIKFLQLLSDKNQWNSFHLKTHQPDLYMRLDTAAMIALNIFPDHRQRPDFSANAKNSSVYGLLNHCRTAQGQRLLMQWLKQPLTDIAKINERLDIVDAFVNDTSLRTFISQDFLGRVPDFERLVRKFIRKKANLEDCYKIYVAVNKMPKLIEYISDFNGPNKGVLEHLIVEPLRGMIEVFSKYIEMVETTIDLGRVSHHEFVIKPDYDKDLKKCREKQDELESKMHDDLSSILHKLTPHLSSTPNRNSRKNGADSSKEAIKLVYDPKQSGWLYRINRKESATLQKQLPNITIKVTKKEGIFFQTSRLNELNSKYSQLSSTYNETSKDVIDDVLNIAQSYCDSLSQLAEILAQLDCLISFATASINGNYTRPILSTEKEKISLVDSRHPCVEKQDNINFISNTVELDRNQQRFQIITGPNMGGKSTYIRQVGVIQLMSQIGCFVPCSNCQTTIVDCILARLGANDDLALGVSTFMSEMLEMSTILDIATSKSLLIIDELGRGTSTYDGFGLAWAVANYICTTIRCFCLFATHFHELTSIASEHENVIENFHVDALPVNDELVLLYKLKAGVCDQSFGIHVAQLAQFPEHVIEFAKQRAQELEEFNSKEDGKENHGHGFASSESVEMIYKELENFKSCQDQEQVQTMIRNLFKQAESVGLL